MSSRDFESRIASHESDGGDSDVFGGLLEDVFVSVASDSCEDGGGDVDVVS